MNIFDIYKAKICSSGIKIIYDETEYHYLRSIPLLNFLGYDLFTYPYSWSVYNSDFTSYKYIIDKELRVKKLPEKLVCITNQYYEKQETQFSINKTIKKYLLNPNCSLLLFLDKKDLEIQGKLRPLNEEHFIKYVYSYDEIYRNIREKYEDEGLDFTFHNTKNLYFQDISILIQKISNDEVVNYRDLFENMCLYPYLPIWGFFTKIFGTKGHYIPAKKNEKKILLSFFQKRIELRSTRLEKSVKIFLDELIQRYIHCLNPVLLRQNIKVNFQTQIDEFKKTVKNFKDELIRKRFLAYLNGN